MADKDSDVTQFVLGRRHKSNLLFGGVIGNATNGKRPTGRLLGYTNWSPFFFVHLFYFSQKEISTLSAHNTIL
ncbi:MAG: hypothetical protein AAB529_00335 [Patescibacteria group bacterium]